MHAAAPSAAKAGTQNGSAIAVVNRCATQSEGGLEIYAQRHLNLAWAADGFIDGAQGRGTVVETRVTRATTCGQRWRPLHRELVVELILRDVIDGDIKAGRIGDVEDVEAVFQHDSLRKRGQLRK